LLTAMSVVPAWPASTHDLFVPKSNPTSTVLVLADAAVDRVTVTLGALLGIAAACTGFSTVAGIMMLNVGLMGRRRAWVLEFE